MIAVLLGSTEAARAERALDKPAFTATPSELLAAAASTPAPADKGHTITLRREHDTSFDAEGRATVRDHRIYVVRAIAADGDDDGDEDELELVTATWRPSFQDRPVIRARVISPSGTVAELDPAQITEDASPLSKYRPVSDRRLLDAKLPPTEGGSIIESEIVTRDREPAIAGGSAVLQLVSMAGASVSYSVPRGRPLRRVERKLPAGVRARHVTTGGRDQWSYDLPVDIESPSWDVFVPPDVVQSGYIGVTTATSWAQVARAYRAVVDRRIADGPVVLSASLPHAPSRDAVDAITAWVRGRVRTGGLEFEGAPHAPSPPAAVLTRGAASSVDVATLLVALLRQAQIRAQVVLVSRSYTRQVDPDLPGLGQFDRAIVRARLPGARGDFWIDPAEELIPPGRIGVRGQGHRALVIADDTTGLIVTPASVAGDNTTREVRSFTATEWGPAALTVVTRATGGHDTELRASFRAPSGLPARRANGPDDPGAAVYGGTLTSATSTQAVDLATPFAVTREIKDSYRVYSGGDHITIELPVRELLDDLPPFIRTKLVAQRVHDFLWSTPHVHEIESRIELPPGFRPPAETRERTAQIGPATYRETRRVEGQTLIVTQRFDSGRARWTARELAALRDGLPALEDEPVRIGIDRVAFALHEAGKLREAAAEDARMIALHPGEALHHQQLAALLIDVGLGDAARREARRAVELAPSDPRALTTLGWVLHHDRLGRDYTYDWDRAGSLEALRKARAVAPRDLDAAVELARALQHGASGALFGADVDMHAVVEAWTGAHAIEHTSVSTLGLVRALLWSGQPVAAETLARGAATSEWRDCLIVFAVAEAQGAPAAIAAAGQLRSGEDRARIIEWAMWAAKGRRQYDLARALFAEIRGANSVEPFWATALAHLSPLGDVAPGSSDPRAAISDLLLALADPMRKTPVFLDARLAGELRARFRRFLRPSPDLLDVHGMYSDVARLAKVQLDGDAGVWHARVTGLWEPTLGIYLVLEGGVAKVVGTSAQHSALGRYLLRLPLRDAAAQARARRLLDWVRSDLDAETWYWPMMFKRVWGGGRPSTVEAIELAAAVLAGDSDLDRTAAIARRCPLPASEARLVCQQLLAYVSNERGRWADAAAAYEAMLALDRDVYKDVLVSYAAAMARAGRVDDAERVVDGLLAEHRDDSEVLVARYWLGRQRGDAAETGRRLEALLQQPRPSSFALNIAAWGQLGGNGDLVRGVTLARQAVELAKGSRAVRNTLAALEAEIGDLGAAVRDNREAMARGESDVPEDSDWYVAARIAEQVGQTGDAIAIYRRIAKPTADRFSVAGLAAQRLAALQRLP